MRGTLPRRRQAESASESLRQELQQEHAECSRQSAEAAAPPRAICLRIVGRSAGTWRANHRHDVSNSTRPENYCDVAAPGPRWSPLCSGRPRRDGEASTKASDCVRIGEPVLTKAIEGFSPFVAPHINLVLVEELMKETPGCMAFAWDASVNDFVRERVIQVAPEKVTSADVGASGAASSSATANAGMGDAAEEERGGNKWVTLAAKRHKESVEVLFDGSGEISTDTAQWAECAEAKPCKAAHMVSLKGRSGQEPFVVLRYRVALAIFRPNN